MADYLGSLAQGLRQAAGVLNPDIQRQVFTADENERAREQQFQMQQQTPQAQIAREQIRTIQEARMRQAAITQDLAQLPPEQRVKPLTMAGVYIKHGDYENAAKHIDRFETVKQKRESDVLNYEARLHDINMRSLDRSLDLSSQQALKQQAAALQKQIAQWKHEIDLGNLEVKRLQAQGTQQQVVANEGKLRDDFNQLSKNFIATRDAHQRVLASANDPSAAGDLSLIFNYMKVLDPISVVRESEFIQAAQTGSYGERIKASVSKVIKGERLSEDIRRDFVDRSNRLYTDAESNQIELEKRFQDMSSRSGVRHENVVIPYRISGTNIPRVRNDADYEKVPKGSEYIAPDGSRRTKQ